MKTKAISIREGEDSFEKLFTLYNRDGSIFALGGASTLTSKIRASPGISEDLVATAVVTEAQSTAVVDNALWTMTTVEMAKLAPGVFYFDIKWIKGGEVYRSNVATLYYEHGVTT